MSKYRKLLFSTGRGTTLIDEDDYRLAVQFRWYLNQGYAATTLSMNGYGREKKSNVSMRLHHLILRPRAGYMIDHINRIKLDNRRENLRHCTAAQNSYNCSANKKNKSGYRGVSFHQPTKTWQVYISIKTRSKNLGYYKSKEAAARAYDVAARKMHGEFAVLNFPEAA